MSAIDRIIKASSQKEEYMTAINKLMSECNDIPLLDLIHKLLLKSI